MNKINDKQQNNFNKNSKKNSLWSRIAMSATKKRKSRRLVRVVILFLMVLSAIPVALSTVPHFFQDSDVKKLLLDHQNIYIEVFIILAVCLGLLSLLFPNDYKEAKNIANIELYNNFDLKADVPKVVWMSLLGAVVLAVIFGWIFIR